MKPNEDRTSLVLKNLGIWTVVCCVSAAPSFVLYTMLSYRDAARIGAMLLGVAIFILAYTAASSTTWAQRLKRKPFVARTLYIGYGIRIGQSLLSIVPPVYIVDMFCGLLSGVVVETLLGDGNMDGFAAILLWTLTQGTVLNLVLFILLLIIYGIQRLFLKPPPVADPRLVCASCGYDLRASTAACPECGAAIPPSLTASEREAPARA
jgi:hypothetical protein